MADPLKFMYNPQFFDRLCPVLKDTVPSFDERRFIHLVFDKIWPDLELKQRSRQITQALHQFMPTEFFKAAEIIMTISKTLLKKKEKEQAYPFIFLPEYIELYGLEDFKTSMKAIEEVTRLVSAEFAIRPFIVRYPDAAMKQMVSWTKHKDASVRRLASEGCRPRLPWAPGLPEFKKDPSNPVDN
jgi:3-methyladenine DNA glycosylase AlkC